MKRSVATGLGLLLLSGCSGNSGPVGENSANSIKTTAVGNIVGTVPSATPTPDAMVDANAMTVDLNAADAAAATISNDTSAHGE